MRRLAAAIAIIAVFLFAQKTIATPLSVEDALKTRNIIRVTTSPSAEKLIFELPHDSLQKIDTSLSEHAPLSRYNRIMIASSDGDDVAELFSQNHDFGYSLVSNSTFSTDQRFLAFWEHSDEMTRPGVFDFENDQVTIFDVGGYFPTLVWVDADEFIIIGVSETSDYGEYGGRYDVPNVTEQNRLRQKGLRHQAVTADVLGGGKYISSAQKTWLRKMLKVNVKTGKTEHLGEDAYDGINGGLSLSPNRQFLANTVVSSILPFNQDVLQSAMKPIAGRRLDVVDLNSGRTVLSTTSSDVAPELLSWSEDSKRLLFFATKYGRPKSEGTLHVFDATTQETHDLGVQGGSSDGRYMDRGETYGRSHIPHGYWVGENVVFIDPKLGGLVRVGPKYRGARVDVDVVGERARPIAKSSNALFFAIDEAIWHVNLDGHTAKLSSLNNQSVGYREYRLRNSRSVNSFYNDIGPLESTPITVVDGDQRSIVYLSNEGIVSLELSLPSFYGQVHFVAKAGVVYSQNTQGIGTQLLYQPANEKAPRETFVFNQHLSHIRQTPEPIRIKHLGQDGDALTSWLILPKNRAGFDGGLAPLIVIPYAGAVYGDTPPTNGRMSGDIWSARANTAASPALFAARGYAVLLPSIPLGLAPEDPMTTLVPPIRSAVEATIDTGLVDPDRMAVVGHSFGGYSALAVATQTNRFSAIIAASPISDLTTLYSSFAPGWRFVPMRGIAAMVGYGELGQARIGGNPWRNTDDYIRNSPFFKAGSVDTPVMLIHGDLDVLSPVQSEQMYTALLRQGKDVLYVRYLGEEHTLNSPKNIHDMWTRVFDFLEDNGIPPGPKAIH